MATIAFTKQAAAHRLIVAAARMHNGGAERLAIHVVAASALNLLRELLTSRGGSYAAKAFEEGLFEQANSRIENREARFAFPESAELEDVINQVVTGIKNGSFVQPSDLGIIMPRGDERKLLDHVMRPYNYLKHADRDPLESLNEADVEADEALMHAITAYSMLFPAEPMNSDVRTALKGMGIGSG